MLAASAGREQQPTPRRTAQQSTNCDFLCEPKSMHASLVRRQLSGLVPPKIASPSILVSTPCPIFLCLIFLYLPAFYVSRRGRVRTSAPSSRSTRSSPRALRPSLPLAASRRATSTARTPRRRPSSSPFWHFSDLGTPSTTRVRGPSLCHCRRILIDFTSRCHSLGFFFVQHCFILVHLSTF